MRLANLASRGLFLTSHSQMVKTSQPILRSAATLRLSRARLPATFADQYSTFDFTRLVPSTQWGAAIAWRPRSGCAQRAISLDESTRFPIFRKSLDRHPKSGASSSYPVEGRLANVTKRGAGCGGRVGVARRATRMRTAKSCGPDLATLGSSWRVDPPATVTRKPGHRGALKPTRREGRTSSANLW
jgi:hypothetical protein